MSTKTILVVLGEPNSTFSEILLKYFKSKKFKKIKKKIVLIGSYDLFKKQMKILNYKMKINKIADINNAIEDNKPKIIFICIEAIFLFLFELMS